MKRGNPHVPHGPIGEAMLKTGYTSMYALAKAIGACHSEIQRTFRGPEGLLARDGIPRPATRRILAHLGLDAADVFTNLRRIDYVPRIAWTSDMAGIATTTTPCDDACADDEAGIIAIVASTLTVREQHVIMFRFWLDETLDQIAWRFDITRERVRQIEAKALCKLRRRLAHKFGRKARAL